jgi:4-hydroxy-tetrahydrodipicolinate synthase
MEYTKKEAKAYARQNMHGLWGSIPYPFRQDHELDENGLLSDLGYYIDTIKIDGFYMGGIINEFWTLSVEERMRAQELLIGEARGKVLTVTMTGHTSVKMSIELSRHAERVGADFIALMNPYYAASKPENSYEYFRAIASEVDVGILILNSPTAGYLLSPEQVARLAEIDNICAIKNDTSTEHTNEIRRLAGDRIVVSDPNEDNWLVNHVYNDQQVFLASPSPHLFQWKNHHPMIDYTKAAQAGDLERAKRISQQLDPLRRVARKWIWKPWASGSLPIARLKYWQRLMGLAGGFVRPPLLEMTEAEKHELRNELEAAGLPIRA